MNTNQATPIWLDMRTEYIDANFDKFVDYLYKNRGQQSDLFYQTSIDLLRRRVVELINALSSVPLSAEDLSEINPAKKQEILFNIKLLGIYLLSESKERWDVPAKAFLYQILLLTQICPGDYSEGLIALAASLLVSNGRFVSGYSWNDIIYFYPEVLAKKILDYSKLSEYQPDERWFEGQGFARTNNKALQITNIEDSGKLNHLQVSISLLGGKLEIMSPQGDKLKQSQQTDFTAISSFVKDYLNLMKPVDLHLGERKLKKYYPDPDASVDVRITDISYDAIKVVTINKEYEPLFGSITYQNTLLISFADLVSTWHVGDELPARIKDINNGVGIFEIADELVKYVVEECVQPGDNVKAFAYKVNNGQHTMWITELGIPVYTHYQVYDEGEMAELEITDVAANGYIKADFVSELDTNYIDTDKGKKELLGTFRYEISEDLPDDATKNEVNRIDTAEIKALIHFLFIQQRLEPDSTERYRLLSALRIICRLLNDSENEEFVDFLAKHLYNMVCFAQGQVNKMTTITISQALLEKESVQRRSQILDVLSCYGREDADDSLENAIVGGDEFIRHLAQLVQSCNRLKGVLSEPMQHAIKYEMLKMLRLNDETETNLEEESGVYLGIENGHQEFKTSIVYPPDNQMQPDLSVQKFNVFRAVCAFLNSESGGIVYLGVNDLGSISGLENDLAYLKKGLDGYMRYITDELIASFGLGVLTFIDIQLMYDDRVVAINIKPCDYKIVELNGKAYIRINAESREMTKSVRSRMLEKKRNYTKSTSEALSSLQNAISNRRQVIVHGYSSSNSGERRDRNLEPFSLSSRQTHVWCYDLDDNKVKLFSLTRINNVEVLEKEWTAEKYHKEGRMDIFNMTGDIANKITLELDRMAYNLIIEEYPNSKRFLSETPQGTWILDTEVYSLYGVGRFYLGLADHITIMHSPELAQYAKDYFQKQLAKQ